ncbi:unnamed protein product, partial [marine sediment metagenome]
ERKGEDSKEKKEKNIYGEFDNILLSETEHKRCIAKHSLITTDKAIEKLSSFKKSNGKTYKSDYAALNTWVWDSLEKNKKSTDIHVDNTLKFGGLSD